MIMTNNGAGHGIVPTPTSTPTSKSVFITTNVSPIRNRFNRFSCYLPDVKQHSISNTLSGGGESFNANVLSRQQEIGVEGLLDFQHLKHDSCGCFTSKDKLFVSLFITVLVLVQFYLVVANRIFAVSQYPISITRRSSILDKIKQ